MSEWVACCATHTHTITAVLPAVKVRKGSSTLQRFVSAAAVTIIEQLDEAQFFRSNIAQRSTAFIGRKMPWPRLWQQCAWVEHLNFLLVDTLTPLSLTSLNVELNFAITSWRPQK